MTPVEKFVLEYFGLQDKETDQNTPIVTDYGQLVNLVAMWEERSIATKPGLVVGQGNFYEGLGIERPNPKPWLQKGKVFCKIGGCTESADPITRLCFKHFNEEAEAYFNRECTP